MIYIISPLLVCRVYSTEKVERPVFVSEAEEKAGGQSSSSARSLAGEQKRMARRLTAGAVAQAQRPSPGCFVGGDSTCIPFGGTSD